MKELKPFMIAVIIGMHNYLMPVIECQIAFTKLTFLIAVVKVSTIQMHDQLTQRLAV